MSSFSAEERRLEEAELEEERLQADRSYIPPFCRTYDEVREWRAGILTEGELRARRQAEVDAARAGGAS